MKFTPHEIKYVIQHDNNLINKFAENSYSSFDYAKVLNFGKDGNKIPEPIIYSIAKNEEYSFHYANALNFGKDGVNVPQFIINSIAEDKNFSFYYAKALNFKNIPIPIYNTLKNINLLPPDATIKNDNVNEFYKYNYRSSYVTLVENIIKK